MLQTRRVLTESAGDTGYVHLSDWLGDDLTPVNAARKSYNKSSDELTEKDKRLINKLITLGHTSTYRHPIVQFVVSAPLLVARQWEKHRIGAAYTFHQERQRLQTADGVPVIDDVELIEIQPAPDLMRGWNERSFRYTKTDLRWYVPDTWRPNKHADEVHREIELLATSFMSDHIRESVEKYEWALANDITPEQARLFLPAYALMTSWMWTVSLEAVMHFIHLRQGQGAQKEIVQYADAVEEMTTQLFPESMAAYRRHLDRTANQAEYIRELEDKIKQLESELATA